MGTLLGALAAGALEEAGLRVPEDVAVIGFDDIPAAALAHLPLTTIAQDFRQAGEMLVDTLIRRIANQPTDATLLAPRLVVRRTT